MINADNVDDIHEIRTILLSIKYYYTTTTTTTTTYTTTTTSTTITQERILLN